MTAVDTNVLVRLLTGDDPTQEAMARRLIARQPIWVAKTVVLETAWVLENSYDYQVTSIRDVLTNLFSIENVHVEDKASVVAALELTTHGVQFADALHLCSRPDGTTFVSFDKALVRRATRAGVARVSDFRE